VSLGWLGVNDMVRHANPQETREFATQGEKQTIEFRAPDGSASIYYLLAGLVVAARHGMQMENGVAYADKLYVDVNIFDDENKGLQESLPQLPASCWDSAECLLEDREVYQEDGVFSQAVIDGTVEMLRSYEDADLSERLYGNTLEIQKLVDQYLYCA